MKKTLLAVFGLFFGALLSQVVSGCFSFVPGPCPPIKQEFFPGTLVPKRAFYENDSRPRIEADYTLEISPDMQRASERFTRNGRLVVQEYDIVHRSWDPPR